MDDPYRIERLGNECAVVHFAPGELTAIRSQAHLDELLGLVDSHGRIAIDFTRTTLVPSDWLRAIERMRVRAGAAGKHLAIAGKTAAILKTADALKLRESLRWCDTIEEALRP
ncbi:MAG: hypothetical protein AB1714_23815 [Acidobacteriota bacterium]